MIRQNSGPHIKKMLLGHWASLPATIGRKKYKAQTYAGEQTN